MRSSVVGWFVMGALCFLSGCGDSKSETPAKSTGGGAGTPGGGSGGSGNAGSGGAAAAGGMAGGGTGGSAQTGTGGDPCDHLVSGDPSCTPTLAQPDSPLHATPCSTEDATCLYSLGTVSAGCVEGTYSCCGGKWTGAAICPMPIPDQDPRCPPDLPPESGPSPPPCTDEGLQCGYYPVGAGAYRQQSIGCCNGRWQFCFTTSTQGPADCACQ